MHSADGGQTIGFRTAVGRRFFLLIPPFLKKGNNSSTPLISLMCVRVDKKKKRKKKNTKKFWSKRILIKKTLAPSALFIIMTKRTMREEEFAVTCIFICFSFFFSWRTFLRAVLRLLQYIKKLSSTTTHTTVSKPSPEGIWTLHIHCGPRD